MDIIRTYRRPAAAVLGMLVLALGTGVTFAAWLDNETALYRTLIDNGLSWCF